MVVFFTTSNLKETKKQPFVNSIILIFKKQLSKPILKTHIKTKKEVLLLYYQYII